MNEEKKQTLAEIERIAGEIAARLGLEIVEFVFHSQGRHSFLRIDVDRPGVPGVGLADCESLSRELGDRIESLPFLESPYELQVSSPGIDRPIKSDDDLRRNAHRLVRVEFRDQDGKVREARGTLAEFASGEGVTLLDEDGELRLDRERIILMKQDVMTAGRKRKNS